MEISFTDSIPCKIGSNSGIYCIKSRLPKYKNKVLYIGSSLRLGIRWGRHRNELRTDIHPNNYLQNHYNKHGESLLYFSLVEELPKASVEYLHERETYWIKKLEPVMNLKLEVTRAGGIPMHWVICSPKGEWFFVHNINEFARQNDLCPAILIRIAHNQSRKEKLKGWFVRHATYTEIKKGKVLTETKKTNKVHTNPWLGVKGISFSFSGRFRITTSGVTKVFNRSSLAIDYLKEYLLRSIHQDFNTIPLNLLASNIASFSYHFLITEDSYAKAWLHCILILEDIQLKGYQGDIDILTSLTARFLNQLADNPKYKPYHNNIYAQLDLSPERQKVAIETRIKDAVDYLKQIGVSLTASNICRASGIDSSKLKEWSHFYKPLINK